MYEGKLMLAGEFVGTFIDTYARIGYTIERYQGIISSSEGRIKVLLTIFRLLCKGDDFYACF